MNSYPWDSLAVSVGEDGYPIYDRAYMASDLQGVQGRFFSNGIFVDEPSAYRPTPGDGMSVMVDVGWCCINGTFGYPSEKPSEQRKMVLQAADSKNRIDTVVLRWNANAEKRTIDLYVVSGAPSDVPVRPALTRSDTVFELGICDVLVPAYTTEVKAERITDTRLENARCGVCVPFAPVSTTEFYDQLAAQTNVAVELANAALNDSLYGQLVQLMHPVGSYYFSDDPTSPASIFGGEWEKLSDVFLRAGNDTSAGGSDTVSLSVENMPGHTHTGPSHTHSFSATTSSNGLHQHTMPRMTWKLEGSTTGHVFLTDERNGTFEKTENNGSHTHTVSGTTGASGAGSTGSTGGGKAFSIMPKYRNTHVWRRVA